MRKKFYFSVLPFLGLGLVALMTALWSGLARLGWNLPSSPQLTLAHGGLILNGFLGVLILSNALLLCSGGGCFLCLCSAA